MLIAQSNISRLIDRLDEQATSSAGPCEEDGRGQRVVITPRGGRCGSACGPSTPAPSSGVGRRVSEREASRLSALLARLLGGT